MIDLGYIGMRRRSTRFINFNFSSHRKDNVFVLCNNALECHQGPILYENVDTYGG